MNRLGGLMRWCKVSAILFGCIFTSLITPVSAATRNIQDNFQVVYHVIDGSGDHVGSQTVTLKIKKVSNGHFYDFSDSTFKGSGWTSKSTNLSEDTTEGFYYYTFDPPASETSVEQYQFLVDNASGTYGDHQSETVTYQKIFNSGSDTVTVGTNNDKTGYRLSAAGVDDVWDEVQSGHSTAGTFGKYLDAAVSSAGGGGLTAGDIADAVWDEALSGHLSSGSTGEKLNAAGAAGDPLSSSVPGSYTSGQAGYVLGQLKDFTDGDKESGSYSGIETLVRRHGG